MEKSLILQLNSKWTKWKINTEFAQNGTSFLLIVNKSVIRTALQKKISQTAQSTSFRYVWALYFKSARIWKIITGNWLIQVSSNQTTSTSNDKKNLNWSQKQHQSLWQKNLNWPQKQQQTLRERLEYHHY